MLKDQGLGPLSAAAVGAALRNNPNFSALDLSNNPIGDKGLDNLIRCMKSNLSIIHLNLSSCDFTAASSIVLKNYMLSKK